MALTSIARSSAKGSYNSTVVTPQEADIINNNEFLAAGNEFLYVENTTAGPLVVTVISAETYRDDWLVTVGASAASLIGPFPAEFRHPGSLIQISTDAAANSDLMFVLVAGDQTAL